jgi:hypothetical protein
MRAWAPTVIAPISCAPAPRQAPSDPRQRRARAAEGDALVEVAIIADHGRFADHDAHAVVDEEPLADHGAGVDLDAGERAAEVGDQAGEERHTAPVERVREPVDLPRMEAGVGEDHLDCAPRRRVARERRLDVAPDGANEGHGGGSPAFRVLSTASRRRDNLLSTQCAALNTGPAVPWDRRNAGMGRPMSPDEPPSGAARRRDCSRGAAAAR